MNRSMLLALTLLSVLFLHRPAVIGEEPYRDRLAPTVNVSESFILSKESLPAIQTPQESNEACEDILFSFLRHDGEGGGAGVLTSRELVVPIPDHIKRMTFEVTVFSREFPFFTGQQSDFDDEVTFEISGEALPNILSGSFSVNDLHNQFELGNNFLPGGSTLVGVFEVDLKDFEDVTEITLRGTARNISDGLLGSGVLIDAKLPEANIIQDPLPKQLFLCENESARVGVQIMDPFFDLVGAVPFSVSSSNSDVATVTPATGSSFGNALMTFNETEANAFWTITGITEGQATILANICGEQISLNVEVLKPSPIQTVLKTKKLDPPRDVVHAIEKFLRDWVGGSVKLPKIEAGFQAVAFEVCCPGYKEFRQDKFSRHERGSGSLSFELANSEVEKSLVKIFPPKVRRKALDSLPQPAKRVATKILMTIDKSAKAKLSVSATVKGGVSALKDFCDNEDPPLVYSLEGPNEIGGELKGSVLSDITAIRLSIDAITTITGSVTMSDARKIKFIANAGDLMAGTSIVSEELGINLNFSEKILDGFIIEEEVELPEF